VKQLELALRLPVDLAIRARLAAQLYCQHLHCTMAREHCIANQLQEPRRTKFKGAVKHAVHAPPHCRSGQCKQGLAVLLEERLLARTSCPTCAGCGWVPKALTSTRR